MSAKSKNRLPVHRRHFGLGGILLAAGALMDQHPASAQVEIFNPNAVLANPAPAPALQNLDQQNQPNEMEVFQQAGGGETVPAVFRYGQLMLRPHVDYSFLYGNGIQYAPGAQSAMIIQQLTPGILIDLGTHWALDYAPSLQFYSSDKFKNTVNQSVALTGMFGYEDWSFALNHSSQFLDSPTVATGGQTEQTGHTTTFSASHPLTSNLSADLGLSQDISLVPSLEDSYDWSTLDWLSYQFWPRLNAGIGIGAGYLLVESQSPAQNQGDLDQIYEDLEARVNWRATDKISFQISGGLDDRQFMLAGASSSLNPIFAAGIQYLPFAHTQLSLTAARSVAASDYYLAAQNTETTSLGVGLSQRLFRQFSLGVSAGYAVTDYTTPGGANFATTTRSDDVTSFNIRLSHPFYKRGNWSVFYQYSKDESSVPGYSFESNQVGFEVGYRF